jgi:single-strand DNA-binding protein
MSVNKVILVGRVGKDPEVRRLDNGTAVAKFSLATSESYKDKDGNKNESTEWHNVVLWRQLAEIAEKFVKKGMLLYIEGKITNREYTDKDNNKKHFTEIVASDFKMLEGKKDGESSNYTTQTQNTPQNAGNAATEPTTDEPANVSEDLPF